MSKMRTNIRTIIGIAFASVLVLTVSCKGKPRKQKKLLRRKPWTMTWKRWIMKVTTWKAWKPQKWKVRNIPPHMFAQCIVKAVEAMKRGNARFAG